MNLTICIDCADPPTLARFWGQVLGRDDLRGDGNPYCGLRGQPPLVFQRVPEARTGKNRLHLDLYVSDPEAEIARVEALGATRMGGRVAGDDDCDWWQVMADPEGNVFCICAGPAESGDFGNSV
jgi:predicted enzyme related to lactoylglutathione lyase